MVYFALTLLFTCKVTIVINIVYILREFSAKGQICVRHYFRVRMMLGVQTRDTCSPEVSVHHDSLQRGLALLNMFYFVNRDCV